jgi:AcrR family transcriptional regulator
MDEAVPRPRQPRRARQGTAERRQEILRAAATVFGSKGYKNGSLADVAEQVGMTHAGVLHHFGSKEKLLIEVLTYRDSEQVKDLEGGHIPGGLELFRHLMLTADMNSERPGIVQTYAVLTGEAVTDGHPARTWATERFEVLRGEIADAIQKLAPNCERPLAETAASAVIGAMDGIQIQWLLDPDAVGLPETTAFAIQAIVAAVLAGADRPAPVPPPDVSDR